MNTTDEVTLLDLQQCGVFSGWYPTSDLTSLPITDLWRQDRVAEWTLGGLGWAQGVWTNGVGETPFFLSFFSFGA